HASTGLREPPKSVRLMLSVSNGRVENLGQDAGSDLQEISRLADPQSLPGGQNDVVATTSGVLIRESHDDDGPPFLMLQSATSLDELLERARVHGVNLSDYPTGLFLTKSVLKRTHPEQWELREMGILSSSSGQTPSPGSWEYFEHLGQSSHSVQWHRYLTGNGMMCCDWLPWITKTHNGALCIVLFGGSGAFAEFSDQVKDASVISKVKKPGWRDVLPMEATIVLFAAPVFRVKSSIILRNHLPGAISADYRLMN
ncbi:hypothetical protein PENSUB_4444, partial [Penicillium subrubescens]